MPNNSDDSYELNYVAANRFYIEMQDKSTISACFSECSGLQIKVNYETYFEGGVNNQQRIILGNTEFSEVRLKRGLSNDLAFVGWTSRMITGLEPEQNRQIDPQRRNINILLFNQAAETIQCWTLIGAVPVGWQVAALQADSNAVVIEELIIAYEGLKVVVNLNPENPSGNAIGGGATIHDRGRSLESGGFFPSN